MRQVDDCVISSTKLKGRKLDRVMSEVLPRGEWMGGLTQKINFIITRSG